MKNSKNGIITLVVEINLPDELVHSKKTLWILYQQCDHLVIVVQLVPEVVRRKMVCRSKDMLRQEVVPNDLSTTLIFMLDK